MMLKFMVYLKGFEEFGKLVELIKKCFRDILDFSLIFMLFNIVFVVIGLVMEVDVDTGDDGEPAYAGLNKKIYLLIYTWRNSVGDLGVPQYSFWTDGYALGLDTSSDIMIVFIWLIWFLNQYINLIIGLNFLISIVGQSYEQVMSMQTFQTFTQRCKILSEYVEVGEVFNKFAVFKRFAPTKSNMFYIYTKESESEKDSSEEWLGITRTVQKHYKRAFKKTELKL
jgi:hypothetical protein